MPSIRTHDKTKCTFESVLAKRSFTHKGGDPRTRLSEVQIGCPVGHVFTTTVGTFLRSTGGCRTCADQNHSDQARDQFLIELAQAGLEPLEPYRNARSKILVKRRLDGETNRISRLDWTTGRKWPEAPCVRLTSSQIEARFLEARPDFKFIQIVSNLGVLSVVEVECPQGHRYCGNLRNLVLVNSCLICYRTSKGK